MAKKQNPYYRPNKNALPPLLDKNAEEQRLKSIREQVEFEKKQSEASKRLQIFVNSKEDKK